MCVCVCVCCVWCVWGSGVIGGCHMTAICELCLATDQPWVISHHYVIMCNCSHSDNKCNIFLAVGIKPVSPNHCCTSNKTLSNLVPSPSMHPSEKWSGDWSQISCTYLLPRSCKDQWDCEINNFGTSHTTAKIYLHLAYFERVWCKMFQALLGDTRKSVRQCKKFIWFTRPFLLVRGWGLGMSLYMKSDVWEVDLRNTLVRSVHNVFSSGDEQYTLPSYV